MSVIAGQSLLSTGLRPVLEYVAPLVLYDIAKVDEDFYIQYKFKGPKG